MNEKIEGAFSAALSPWSDDFMGRIRTAYRSASAVAAPNGSPLWTSIGSRSQAVHDALVNDSSSIAMIKTLLSDPARHYLLYGFDNLFKEDVGLLLANSEVRSGRFVQIETMLKRLSEAVGSSRLYNKEFGQDHPHARENPATASAALEAISEIVGPLKFPNAFPNEHGIPTRNGVVSHRAVHAIYGGFRAKTLSAEFGQRVLEIGAGLGRSAFYSYEMGVTDYTLVDLPMTSVAQALFLGHALGEDKVTLTGEDPKTDCVAIVSPACLRDLGGTYDVFINVDSLTEMSVDDARNYVSLAYTQGAAFLSINHEANGHLARNVIGDHLVQRYRAPYWLRSGYVEELFVSRPT